MGDISVLVEPVPVRRDGRGEVFEPVGLEALRSQANVHVVTTRPGGIRGNHYHRRGSEVAVVAGPAKVRLKEGGRIRDVDVPPGQLLRFTIPPGVAHAIQNTGRETSLVVAFNSVVHDPEHPDVVREVLIDDQPIGVRS